MSRAASAFAAAARQTSAAEWRRRRSWRVPLAQPGLSAVGCAAPTCGVADVGLYQQQLLQEFGDVGLTERRQHLARNLATQRGQAHQGRASLIGQVKQVGAPVAWVRAPLDQT